MNRRRLLLLGYAGIASNIFLGFPAFGRDSDDKEETIPLVTINLPSPSALRGGWAALAAVMASRGWTKDVFATASDWVYHDGGGNWLVLRRHQQDRIVLFGHDHEYSYTYFREAAEYFDIEETDLLAGAPGWWDTNLEPNPFGDWIGFIYGWDGSRWQRAAYDEQDGFEQVGLLRACSTEDTELLGQHCEDAPGLNGRPPSPDALKVLVDADADITASLLEAVVPGWDIDTGVAAGRRFLEMRI